MSKYKIYPKQFRNEIVTIEKNKCFMIMQFSDDLDIVYGTIKEELNKDGYICNRADDILGSPIILNKILKEMLSSRFIIADLTHTNPNVFYELGIAHSFKDSSNIILIKQYEEECPFDISHLTYIEYSPNNLKYLIAQIKSYIHNNQYLSDFYEILNIRGIINFICDNQDEFVEYVKNELSSSISVLTDFLINGGQNYTANEQEQIFKKFEDLIKKTVIENMNFVEGVINIYFELILSCAPSEVSETYVNKFVNFNFGVSEEISWKTDLMLKLAENRKFKNICIPWIINYFAQLHATKIDLNRYKLEKFLMTTNFAEIDDAIINSLFNSDCYVREYMSDIIGEKRIYGALPSLYTQLETEENCYVARSMIQAISKLDDISGINRLNNWLERNLNTVLDNKYYTIIRHMYLAIIRLDSTQNKRYVSNFISKYGNYLDDYIL